MSQNPRVLIVGAGAVGMTYADCLLDAGADVTFYVRQKYVDGLKDGYRSYALNNKPRWDSDWREGFSLVSSAEQVAENTYDFVVLAMSSTGLRGDWWPPFAKALGDAVVITLQPGIDDRAWILQHTAEERLLTGMITFIAFHAPLPQQELMEPGNAFWYPPLSPNPFSGPEQHLVRWVSLLKKGGMPSKRAKLLHDKVGFPTAALMPVLASLEAHGWNFARMRKEGGLGVASQARGEAIHILAASMNKSAPIWHSLINGPALRFAMFAAPMLIPFDIEIYLKEHFVKVGDQTRMLMDRYIELAGEHDKPSGTLQHLRSAIGVLE